MPPSTAPVGPFTSSSTELARPPHTSRTVLVPSSSTHAMEPERGWVGRLIWVFQTPNSKSKSLSTVHRLNRRSFALLAELPQEDTVLGVLWAQVDERASERGAVRSCSWICTFSISIGGNARTKEAPISCRANISIRPRSSAPRLAYLRDLD